MPKNIGKYKMSVEYILESLNLPSDTIVVGAEFDAGSYSVEIVLSHPDIEQTQELEPIPDVLGIFVNRKFTGWKVYK